MAFTLVQQAANVPGTSPTSLSQAFSSNVSPNNTLVLIVVLAGSGAAFGAVSDTRGNTWTQIPTFPFNTATLNTAVSAWWAPSGAAVAGADTVSIGTCATNIRDFLIAEFTGLTSGADGNGQGGTGSGTPTNTPTFSPTVAGDLVINFERVANQITVVNAPWTLIGSLLSDGNAWGYQASASSGTQTPNMTQSPGGSWAGITFGLKGPAAVAITASASATAQSTAAVTAPTKLTASAVPTAQSTAVVMIPTTAYETMIQAESSLVSYWRMGEASGNFLDSKDANPAPNINGAIARRAPPLIINNIDYSASGGGASGTYASASLGSNAQPATISVELWAKPAALAPTTSLALLESFPPWLIEMTNTGRWHVVVQPVSGGNLSVDTASAGAGLQPQVGVIHHLVLTYDPADALRFYVNGQLVGFASASSALSYAGMPLYFFAQDPVTAGFPGALDEIAIYNTALSPARIATHYATGSGLPYLTATASATSQGAATVKTTSPLVAQGFATAQSTAAVFTLGAQFLLARAFPTASASASVFIPILRSQVYVSATSQYQGIGVSAALTTGRPKVTASVALPTVVAMG